LEVLRCIFHAGTNFSLGQNTLTWGQGSGHGCEVETMLLHCELQWRLVVRMEKIGHQDLTGHPTTTTLTDE